MSSPSPKEQPPPPPPTVQLSAKATAQLSRSDALLASAKKISAALKDRFVLLEVACQEANLAPRTGLRVPARYASSLPALIKLLGSDKQAAQIVASVVAQYREVQAELQRLEAALETGQLDHINVERSRGKMFFLTRIPFFFRDYPLLGQIFDLPRNMAPAGRNATPTIPLNTKREEKLSERDRMLKNGKKLLHSFQVKMIILQAAIEQINGAGSNLNNRLPFPARQTVQHLVAALANDAALRQRIERAIKQFGEAQALLSRPAPASDLGNIRSLLTALSALPHEFKGNAILTKIFAPDNVG